MNVGVYHNQPPLPIMIIIKSDLSIAIIKRNMGIEAAVETKQ